MYQTVYCSKVMIDCRVAFSFLDLSRGWRPQFQRRYSEILEIRHWHQTVLNNRSVRLLKVLRNSVHMRSKHREILTFENIVLL